MPVALIAGALALNAQPWPAPYPTYQRPPSGRYERRPDGGPPVLQRVRSDLRRASSQSYFRGGERGHFDRALGELDRFEQRLRYGQWDGHALDKAIENIDHLARSRQVHPRDRDVLREDLWALRDFRSHRRY